MYRAARFIRRTTQGGFRRNRNLPSRAICGLRFPNPPLHWLTLSQSPASHKLFKFLLEDFDASSVARQIIGASIELIIFNEIAIYSCRRW
jgi:hypothetical protein